MISAPPQSVAWFVRHELLLAWRDWLSMMTAGKLPEIPPHVMMTPPACPDGFDALRLICAPLFAAPVVSW